MLTFLFIIIAILFIGLGLPDSLLGSAWPVIYVEFNIGVSTANILTILISLGTTVASLFSARLINKFGTGTVTAVSTLVSCFTLLGFALSPSIWWMTLLAIPLGAGAGAIDSALNNFVATHYNSTIMNFSHCFYGLGVALSPAIMSFALSINNDWRLGYRTVFFIMLSIAVIAALSIPVWKKIGKKDAEQDFKPKTLSLLELAKMPAVRAAWVVFFTSVALEFTCGIWGCTFLVSSENMLEAEAAKVLTFYYIGMTAGRFTSGVVSNKLHPKTINNIGYTIVGVAIAVLIAPVPATVKGVALFMIGFGNGPTFPNLTYLTPINFGKEISQSVIGTQMACCNLGIVLMPPVFGFMAQFVGTNVFPFYLAVLFIFMVIYTVIYNKRVKTLHEKRFNA